MFCLRRVALRALSSPSPTLSFAAKPRSITTLTPSILRQPRHAIVSQLQKRFASDEAQPAADAHAAESEAAPVAEFEDSPERNAAATPTEEFGSRQFNNIARPALSSNRRDGSASPPSVPSNTVYVGNLFFDVTEEDLKREFSRFGGVDSVRIVYDGRGLSKGFGYVALNDIATADEAIKNMDNQVFEGRRMTVQYSHGKGFRTGSTTSGRDNRSTAGTSEPTKTLFIGNMSFEMSDQDLNEMFKDVKNVVDVRVAIDRRTGQPRGFAHADFIDVASAEAAYKQLISKEVYGRMLRVDYSESTRHAGGSRG